MQIEINFEYIRLTRLLETRGDVRVRQAARRVVERPLRGLHRVHGAEDLSLSQNGYGYDY